MKHWPSGLPPIQGSKSVNRSKDECCYPADQDNEACCVAEAEDDRFGVEFDSLFVVSHFLSPLVAWVRLNRRRTWPRTHELTVMLS